MPKEFVDKIRAKYPGAYDQLDDQTLAQKVLAKYPQYEEQLGDIARGGPAVGPQKPYEPEPGPESQPRPYGERNLSGLQRGALNATNAFTAPFKTAGRGLQELAAGDGAAGGAALLHALIQAPGAAFSPLQMIPGVSDVANKIGEVTSAPGREVWNEGMPALKNWFDQSFPNHPTPFSATAVQEANGLGEDASGFGSQLLTGEVGAGALGAAKAGFNAAAPKMAASLTKAAYKIPPMLVKAPIRQKMYNTIQRFKLLPTQEGMDTIQGTLNDLNQLKANLINDARAAEWGVQTADIVAGIDDLVKRWSKSDTPVEFQKVLTEYRDKVLEQHPATISLDDAISLQDNLQDQLRPLYEKALRVNPAVRDRVIDEAKSSVEQAVRAEIERLVPGIKEANAQMHDLLQVKPYVERAMNRISNYDKLKLRDIAASGMGAAGGALAGGPMGAGLGSLVAEIAQRIMTDPRNWARLGNRLAGMAGKGGKATAPASATAIMAPAAATESGWQKHPSGFEFRPAAEGAY